MEKEVVKICILIPYFGKWPDWFSYFLKSCSYNPDIDWYFFSDAGNLPIQNKNLFLVQMTLNDFNILASRKLQHHINIKYPYKLCDIKPAYGRIFEEFVKQYDFWGYGDLDLLYGNIRQFLNQEILSSFDIISCHSEFVSGHLCFLRNSPEILDLYREGDHYKSVFRKKFYLGFDEQIKRIKVITNPTFNTYSKRVTIWLHLFTNKIYKISRYLCVNKRCKPLKRRISEHKINNLKDFTSIVKQHKENKDLKVHFRTIFLDDLMFQKMRIKNWNFVWDRGQLTEMNSRKEVLYFHFMISKTKDFFSVSNFNPLKSKIVVTRAGIQSI